MLLRSLVLVVLIGLPLPLAAQGKKKQADLPLKEVVLFSSGVGFYERNAEIEGDAEVTLQFRVDKINDLLKSMVVQDLDGGEISTINYSSRDPITKTLSTFAIDLTSNPTIADLLNQVRGEKVRVSTPNKIEGTIVGVEKTTVPVEDQQLKVEYLLLLTDGGLRRVNLADVQEIQLLDPKLQNELRQALTILALGHDSEKKTVGLQFRGVGQRNVRVGYIMESPVWKTSYRLVLDDADEALLQGWAIVENTTEDDWKDVNLTLVSGRPISFRMDLYSPLYVNRPLVEPELYASLRPQTYGQDLQDAEMEFLAAEQAQEKAKMTKEGIALAAPSAPGRNQRRALAGRGAPLADKGMLQEYRQSGSVKSMAQAAEVGELFRYVIENPVDIDRRQSAMLPIVNESVKAEKLSIYNQNVHVKHPLNGLRLKNTTNLHLMQGPITVFDSGAYAGDARLTDLQAGSSRLVSYAMDLNVEVDPSGASSSEYELSIKIVHGTMVISKKAKMMQEYTIKNSGSKEKTVLIEHPKNNNYQLIKPEEATEVTRDMYRFAVKAAPGVPEKLSVVQERTYDTRIAVSNISDSQIRYYVSRPAASPELKKALEQLIEMKTVLARLAAQRNTYEREISAIESEQSRIRRNMAQLDKGSDLFGRYVKKFNEQEDRLEVLRKEIEKLQEQETNQQKKINDYLRDLDVE